MNKDLWLLELIQQTLPSIIEKSSASVSRSRARSNEIELRVQENDSLCICHPKRRLEVLLMKAFGANLLVQSSEILVFQIKLYFLDSKLKLVQELPKHQEEPSRYPSEQREQTFES